MYEAGGSEVHEAGGSWVRWGTVCSFGITGLPAAAVLSIMPQHIPPGVLAYSAAP